MGSNKPSPANVSPSTTLKLPTSRVSPVELVSHRARWGRGSPACSFQIETFSALMDDCTIGTNAERFLAMVIGSFSLYSKRSPNSWAWAADSELARAAAMSDGFGAPLPAPMPAPRRWYEVGFRELSASPPPL